MSRAASLEKNYDVLGIHRSTVRIRYQALVGDLKRKWERGADLAPPFLFGVGLTGSGFESLLELRPDRAIGDGDFQRLAIGEMQASAIGGGTGFEHANEGDVDVGFTVVGKTETSEHIFSFGSLLGVEGELLKSP